MATSRTTTPRARRLARPARLRPGGRRIGPWARRGLLVVLALLVGLSSAGVTYQTVAEARDRRAFPPPGRLVDVGGYRLHLDVAGEDRGGPTVLLDAAWGGMSAQWGWVQPEVARFARVVAYDRPGQGYSETPPAPLDARAFAADLHEALAALGVRGPYVPVGHSMGGLTARAFAALYPGEIAGVVLVDARDLGIAAHTREVFPEQGPVSAAPTLAERLVPPLLARLGIMRLTGPLGEYVAQLPPPAAGRARAALASTRHWQGAIPDALLGESAAELLARDEHLAGKPVVVLSAGAPDPSAFPGPSRARFTALHTRLAGTLSERGEHRVVAGADHYTIVTQQEYATAVTGAIRQVLGGPAAR